KSHNVDAIANRGDWAAARRAVNGGLNGYGRFMEVVRKLQAT
ncbi:MAG: hypothetical protein JWM80_2849, partial [Cyanobacteria bacterium RYN_339]|nr:hypothetical protein [Cyanobacteria bacterium RYN_339]